MHVVMGGMASWREEVSSCGPFPACWCRLTCPEALPLNSFSSSFLPSLSLSLHLSPSLPLSLLSLSLSLVIFPEPSNIFFAVYKTDNAPIRLSYHGGVHYNSVVDPYKATIGVGLGLAGYKPGVSVWMWGACVHVCTCATVCMPVCCIHA